MKKFLTIFLALLLLASVFPFAVSAHNETNAGTINDFKGIIDTDAVRDPAYEAFGLKKNRVTSKTCDSFALQDGLEPTTP